MAGSPKWKVFNPQGKYVASCLHIEDAAAIISAYGEGATLRWGHRKCDTFWIEGEECAEAGDSYDRVARIVGKRFDAWREQCGWRHKLDPRLLAP